MVETRRLTEMMGRLGGLLQMPEGHLAVAVSGGADSAALAFLLASRQRPFRAVHVNHGFPGSLRLEEAARAVAGSVGANLDVLTIEVPSGASAEGQARDARYAAFRHWLAPVEWLLTAHTLEDQAETVLMNLVRGSGPSGLSGIPPRSGSVVRPMLGVSRSQTRELAGLAGLPFFDDPTNLDRGLRRNAFRLEVLPALAARFNPRLVEALARSATLLRSDDAFLQGEAESVPLLRGDNSVAVARGDLLAVPGPVADRVLRRCLAVIRPPHSGTSAEMDAIRAVAAGTRKGVGLAGGVEVALDGPLLVFGSDRGIDSVPDRIELGVGAHLLGRFEILVERVDGVCRVAPIGPWSAIFAPGARLSGRVDETGRLVVEANAQTAWVPGERRLGVAWYQPGTSGYLSVFAREESGWTSSP